MFFLAVGGSKKVMYMSHSHPSSNPTGGCIFGRGEVFGMSFNRGFLLQKQRRETTAIFTSRQTIYPEEKSGNMWLNTLMTADLLKKPIFSSLQNSGDVSRDFRFFWLCIAPGLVILKWGFSCLLIRGDRETIQSLPIGQIGMDVIEPKKDCKFNERKSDSYNEFESRMKSRGMD